MNTSKQKSSLSDFQRQFISSALGSASASLLLSPLTVVKVRLQHLVNRTSPGSRLIDVVRNIHRNEGVGGFWNGGKTALIQGLPSSIIYLTMYERIKKEMCDSTEQSSSLRLYIPPICAAIARTVSVSCVAPLELIRTIQAGGIEKSITGIVRDVVQQTGVRGLYKGWWSTIMRDVPYSALYWSSFENLKPMYRRLCRKFTGITGSGGSESGSALSFATFLAGATAGGAAAFITHPFDVLKTATQLEHVELEEAMVTGKMAEAEVATAMLAPQGTTVSHTHTHAHTHTHECIHARPSMVSRVSDSFRIYRNWLLRNKNEHQCCVNSHRCTANNSLHVLINIYKQHGIVHGLYRGLSLRLMMVIPGGAILVTIYETVQRYL